MKLQSLFEDGIGTQGGARPLSCQPYESRYETPRQAIAARKLPFTVYRVVEAKSDAGRYPGRLPEFASGMAVSGDKSLQRAAAAGLHTLAEHQASNGQIAKFVDLQRQEADFWYLGCIDSTLWWLIALAFLDRRRCPGGLRRKY